MSSPILRTSRAVRNPALSVLPCPTCDYGECPPGTNCDACLEAARQSDESRERERRQDLFEKLATAAGCRADELRNVLLGELAVGMAEIAGAVMDERGTP